MQMSEFHETPTKYTVKYIACSLKWYINYASWMVVLLCTFKLLRALLLHCASYIMVGWVIYCNGCKFLGRQVWANRTDPDQTAPEGVIKVYTVCHSARIFYTHYYMRHIMRKRVFAICEQQRRRSACAPTQSDQHLCFRYVDSIIILAKSKISRL